MNHTSRFARSAFVLVAGISLATACAGNPDPEPEPELVAELPVRVAPPAGALMPGDCP
jgi:hypothetical protein